jgi:hypothetical protein
MRRALMLVSFVGLTIAAKSDWARGESKILALDLIAARQEALSNLSVDYQETETLTPPPELIQRLRAVVEGGDDALDAAKRLAGKLGAGANMGRAFIRAGTVVRGGLFKHAGRRTYYEERLILQTDALRSGHPPLPSVIIKAFDGDRFEYLYDDMRNSRNSLDLLWDCVLDLALGLRARGENQCRSADDWRACTFTKDPDGTVTCKRVIGERQGGERLDAWRFDPRLNYALIKYEVLRRKEGKAEFRLYFEIDNSDFRMEDKSGLTVPYAIAAREFYPAEGEENPLVTRAAKLKIGTYSVGQLKGVDDEFSIRRPGNGGALDSIDGTILVARNGPEQAAVPIVSGMLFGNSVTARQVLDTLLSQKVAMVDEVCSLTEAQKQKLDLAVRANVKSVLDRAEEVGTRFQLGEINCNRVVELPVEAARLVRQLDPSFFDDSSVFAKVLNNTLTVDQAARFQPYREVFQAGGQVTRRQRMSGHDLEVTLPGTADDVLAHVGTLSDLKRLELRRSQVTDAGLAHIEGLTNLTWLGLEKTRVTDAALTHLKGLTRLKTVVVIGTHVTEAGIAEFQHYLPGSRVVK